MLPRLLDSALDALLGEVRLQCPLLDAHQELVRTSLHRVKEPALARSLQPGERYVECGAVAHGRVLGDVGVISRKG